MYTSKKIALAVAMLTLAGAVSAGTLTSRLTVGNTVIGETLNPGGYVQTNGYLRGDLCIELPNGAGSAASHMEGEFFDEGVQFSGGGLLGETTIDFSSCEGDCPPN